MLKKWNIFKHFGKEKNLFFANIYQSQYESHLVLKIETPLAQCLFSDNCSLKIGTLWVL
jgi:hypothetical protein